ncbi:hypothetical protein AWB88_02835 [Mycobacterium paraense]|nr:hypothetical protein AWB88_02835 [Mycobacterium paraense]
MLQVVPVQPQQWWRGLLTAASYAAAVGVGALTVVLLMPGGLHQEASGCATPSDDVAALPSCPGRVNPARPVVPDQTEAPSPAPVVPVQSVPVPDHPAATPAPRSWRLAHHEDADQRYLALYAEITKPVFPEATYAADAVRLGEQTCGDLTVMSVAEAAEILAIRYTAPSWQAIAVVRAAQNTLCPQTKDPEQ